MRVLLAIVFLASPALADPVTPASGSATEAGTGSALVTRDRERPEPPAERGGDLGFIIVPKPITDAQPYPRGMVIAPPDVGDRMANLVASPWTWGSRSLWQRLEDGLGALWNALQSPHL
jgi:hypothetical protein